MRLDADAASNPLGSRRTRRGLPLSHSPNILEKLYEKGPPMILRYSSRYEKTLPYGPFRCPLELHRTSHADTYRAWTTGDPQPPRVPKRHPIVVEDLAPVGQEVMRHFESQDYEVTEAHIPTGGVQVSIRRGGTFKAIIGMKTALNIRIEPEANGTTVEAGVGIFGQQAIPTAITLLVFWPVIIAQVWNMAQEAKLDEEALRVAEKSLKAHSSKAPSGATAE